MLGFEETTHVGIYNSDFKNIKCSLPIGPNGEKKTHISADSPDLKLAFKESKGFLRMKNILQKSSKGEPLLKVPSHKTHYSNEKHRDIGSPRKKIMTRPASPTFSRNQSLDKTIAGRSFVITRKASAEMIKRHTNKPYQQSFLTKTTESTSKFIYGTQINTLEDAWCLITDVISQIESHINHQTWLKMFSRDMVLRLSRIVERKKDDLAMQDMRKLEIKYGKKIAQLYDKAQRFTFLKNYNLRKEFMKAAERGFRLGYIDYEFSKFNESFIYGKKLVATNIDILAKYMNQMPCLSIQYKKFMFTERSQLWPLRNVQTYKLYVFLTEDLLQRILKYSCQKNRQILKQFKRLQQDHLEEHSNKDGLISIVDLMNFRGPQFDLYFNQSENKLPRRVLDIIKTYAYERIDWQLANLFLGFSFFTYYCLKKNIEKGYVVMCRAYDQNKEMVDLYLSIIVKYFCTRDQLIYYLGEADRRQPERATYADISFSQYCAHLNNLDTRLPYIYDFIENTLQPCLKVEELQEILKEAGKMALKLNDFSRAVLYLENYLFMLDSVDRVNINRLLVHGKIKESKVNEILYLNKKYMKYTNKLLRACFETCKYVKALTLITNLLFIFNNSLNLINYFDPNSHPTKKPNEVIMMDLKKFAEISETKKYYKSLLIQYTKEWKTAMDFHNKIWDIISQVQHKNEYKQSFFLAFREVVEYTESLKLYNLTNFVSFVERYTNLPAALQTAAAEEGRLNLESLTLQEYMVEKQMDYYFPTYVGDFDKGFVDRKVLECLTMNKENNQKLKKILVRSTSLNTIKSVYKDTEAFKCKRIKKLQVWEVEAFFSISFDDTRFINGVFRNMIAKYYEVNNKLGDRRFVTFKDTVLKDADDATKAIIDSALSILQRKWRQVLKEREYARVKALTRDIYSWAQKAIHPQKKGENQEKLNNIRSVEMREFGVKPYKPTRFYRESRTRHDQLKLENNLNAYDQSIAKRIPQISKLRRVNSSRNYSEAKIPRFLDNLNLEVFTPGYYCVHNKLNFIKANQRRIKQRAKAQLSLDKIRRFQKASRLVSIMDQMIVKKKDDMEESNREIKNANGDYYHVDGSLSTIQMRKYNIDFTDLSKHKRNFIGRCEVQNMSINYVGEFKSQKSANPIRVTLAFPLTKDIMMEKEVYIMNLKFIFQSYWPIIFHQFKHDYLLEMYSMSKERAAELLGKEAAAYKNFVHAMGVGFDLNYTNYRYPIPKAKFKMRSYHKEDFHSLQLLNSNLWLLFKIIDSLMHRGPLGFSCNSVIGVQDILYALASSKLNIGVYYFYSRRVKDWMAISRENHRHLFTSSQVEDLSVSDYSAIDQVFRILELFKLKCEMIRKAYPEKKVFSAFLCKANVQFIRGRKLVYQIEFYLDIHLAKVQNNLNFLIEIYRTHISEITCEYKMQFFLLLLLFFMEKTFEFDIRIFNFACQKAQRYKSTIMDYEKSNPRKKYVLKRNRFFKIDRKDKKLSFLQFYYLTHIREVKSRPTFTWDFAELVAKDSFLKDLTRDYQKAFDLATHLTETKDSVLELLKSVLIEPLVNSRLKFQALSLIEQQNSVLMYFMREKHEYHFLIFTKDDTRMDHNQVSEFMFEYEKLDIVLDIESKLLLNSLLHRFTLMQNGQENVQQVNIAFLTIPTKLRTFLKGNESAKLESHGQKSAVVLLDKGLHRISQGIYDSRNRIARDENELKFKAMGLVTHLPAKNVQKSLYFEKLLAVDFDKITRKGFRQLQEKDLMAEKQQIIEIFDEKSALVAKGVLVYAESREQLANVIRRYYQTRDSNVDLVDTKGMDFSTYHIFMNNLWKEVCLTWNIDFNCSSKDFVQQAAAHHKTGHHIYQKVFFFASWSSACSDFSDVFDAEIKVYTENFADRLVVKSIRLSIKYPITELKLRYWINTPSNILFLLRILRMRSLIHLFLKLRFHFGRNNIDSLPIELSRQRSRFKQLDTNCLISKQAVIIYRTDDLLPLNQIPNEETSILSLYSYYSKWPQKYKSPALQGGYRELKLLNKHDALSKPLQKLQRIGYVNPIMARLIKPKHTMPTYSLTNQSAIKYQLSKTHELIGKPAIDSSSYQNFSFSFFHRVAGCKTKMFVKSDIFVILSNHLPREDREVFEDCHTVKEFYLETLANRIKQISRLYMRGSRIESDDVPYVKKRLVRSKFRSALGISGNYSISGLSLWKDTINKIGDTLQQYKGSAQNREMDRANERLINIIGELRAKQIVDDKLVLDSEKLVICFELTPSDSRNIVHKLIYSWKDIKKFFLNENFIRYLFPDDTNRQKYELYFSNNNPKQIVIGLLRHILDFCELRKQKVFSVLVSNIPSSAQQQLYLKNIWSRFNRLKAQSHEIMSEEFSKNNSVVYHGIKRLGNQYYILTIQKNSHLKLFEVTFYNTRYCRQYSMLFKASSIAKTQKTFIGNLTRFLHHLEPSHIIRNYKDFDSLWYRVNSDKKVGIIRMLSEISLLGVPGMSPLNDTMIEPENSAFDTSIINILGGSSSDFSTVYRRNIDRKTSISRSILDRILPTNTANDEGQDIQHTSLSDLLELPDSLIEAADIFGYWSLATKKLQSTLILRSIKSLERFIFSISLLAPIKLEEGSLSNELLKFPGAKFSNYLVRRIDSMRKYFEIEVFLF